MKLCVKPVISAPFGWCRAWLWISIFFCIHCPSLPPTPHLTQKRISFLFVSAIIGKWCTAPSPSLSSLKGIHKLFMLGGGYMCRSCPKAENDGGIFIFFPVAAVADITATVNMRLNKETWQKLDESICMSPESRYGPESRNLSYRLAAIVTFFFFFKPSEWSRALCCISLIRGHYWLNE